MGLFDNLGQNPPAGGSGSLFGGNPAASSAAQKPSLFSFAQNNQPASSAPSGGLFASGTAASTSAPATGGLFGPSTQTHQQSTGGWSGGLQRTQPQQGTGLFNTSTQPTQQSGLLGGSLLGQSQQPASQVQTDPNAQSKSATTLQAAYFDQILERGKKREKQENGLGGLGDLPTLQLGLGDIARKVRNLGQGGPTTQKGKGNDSRAHYLLAASGVSTSSALRDLNNLNAQAGAVLPPSNVLPDTDPETFVSNLRSQTTLDLIQHGLEQSKRDFDAFLEENVQMNWDAQRLKIYEHFGLAKPGLSPDSDDIENSLGGSQRERGAFGRSSRRSRPLGASSAGMSFGPNGMARSVLGTSALRGSTQAASFSDVPEKTQKSSSGNSLVGGLDDRLQRDKSEKYAAKIFSREASSLNGERNRETCFPVLHQFAEVEQSVGIDHTAALVNSYEALISVTGEPAETKEASDPTAIKERHFAKQYLDDSVSSPESANMRKRILNGSRKCLENMYYRKVTETVNKDLKTAQLGGMPTKTSYIRGFVRVLDSRRELGDTSSLTNIETTDGSNDFTWVILYTFLRCGLVQEAADYVQQNITSLRSIDRKFPPYILEYSRSPDRLLSRENRSAINTEYTQSTKSAADGTSDPYRAACYKIVGRCELSRRVLDNIKTDEEDWVWLQFALAREVSRSEEQAGEVFGLEQIRETITDIGKRHFSQAADNPGGFGLFFFMQILAGMFEKAVAWLYPQNHISAVHFAIALSYYGLLRVTDLNTSELLSYTTRQQARINFALMVGYYTSDFRAAKPVEAADYLCLINLNSDLPGDAGIQQAKICWEALRELVLETREFAALLGDLREDGTRVQGAVEHRARLIKLKDDFISGKRKTQDGAFDTKKFMDELTVRAAIAADESGRTTDAVLLYHLASDYDAVLTIINRTLSEALTVSIEAEPLKIEATKPAVDPQAIAAEGGVRSTFSLATVDDPITLARNFTGLYASNAVIMRQIKDSTREACQILLILAEAKRLLRESLSAPINQAPPFTASLEAISRTHLLPLDAHSDMNVIRTVAGNFQKQPQVVARTVGDVILWAVQAVRSERRRLASTAFEDANKRAMEKELEAIGKDLMVFAGLVKFRLSPRVFEVLAGEGGDGF